MMKGKEMEGEEKGRVGNKRARKRQEKKKEKFGTRRFVKSGTMQRKTIISPSVGNSNSHDRWAHWHGCWPHWHYMAVVCQTAEAKLANEGSELTKEGSR